jgi:hypothetical protein
VPELPVDVQQALANLCRRRQVARLFALDGLDASTPVLRLAVEFLPRTGFGAYLMARFEQELSDLFARPVDLRMLDELAAIPPDGPRAEAMSLFERYEGPPASQATW